MRYWTLWALNDANDSSHSLATFVTPPRLELPILATKNFNHAQSFFHSRAGPVLVDRAATPVLFQRDYLDAGFVHIE
jgi:hypothetical protein